MEIKESLAGSRKDVQIDLYKIVDFPGTPKELEKKQGKFTYGYNKEYDIVIISKDGTLGEIYEINGLKIGLPKPSEVHQRSNKKQEQYWERLEFPAELKKVRSAKQWNEMLPGFKSRWEPYIDKEWDRRENGFWFMNNGQETYITGSHYMYVQWAKIDVGYADYREANRIFHIYWEACKADSRSYGMNYLKIRRSGFSFMADNEIVNQATMTKEARFGILSKTGDDAKTLFTDKVVNTSNGLPFFFKPVQDGMDKPKTELAYRLPAMRITRKNLYNHMEDSEEGLNSSIDWKNTGDNSYDGEKLKLLIHDECYSPETKILMSDFSFKEIKDIEIGDSVMVEGGKIKKVVKKTSGETERFLVKQPYGEDYIVTKNHRLVFNDYNKGEVILKPEQYINASKYRKKHLTRVTSKGVEMEDSFRGMPPYLLGLWLGDGRKGCMTILVNKEEEPEILQYLGRIAQMRNIDFKLVKTDSKKVIQFRFLGINNELRKIGVQNNKHIPIDYMKSSIDSRLQLLAGIIESDGYSDKNKNIISIGMSKKDLINQIRILALSCGLSCSSVKEKTTNFNSKSYNISISGNLSEIPLITEKKSFEGYNPITRGRRNKVWVEKLDIGPYVGIQVDAENDDERKLILSDFTISMNSGKWLKPNNITNNWKVTKTCLRLGSRVIGKCMMGSTCNALEKGGQNFKDIYEDSDPLKRSKNGQTKSGLYKLFIPMEWNMEGFIDRYGFPVFRTPEHPVLGVDGEMIEMGAIDYWENEVESLKGDPDALNEFYRQFPRSESHAFRDESKSALFDLTRIYDQIDFNDSQLSSHYLTKGRFEWRDGIKDTEVIWVPDSRGRFLISWVPAQGLRNRFEKRGDLFYPLNEHIGAFGCDPYDISGTVDGRGSNGSLHGLTKNFSVENAPVSEFFLEYIARPQTAEIFYEECLMALVFYGMPVLAENNKPRFLYHLKNRGYRPFSMNRPDKPLFKLSVTEKELGGIPNNSEDVKQIHSDAIQTYINKNIGYDREGTYRDPGEIGNMPFTKTLNNWARFDINNRTKFDAAISSGLAIMANQKTVYLPDKQKAKVSINIPKYKNSGLNSQLVTSGE